MNFQEIINQSTSYSAYVTQVMNLHQEGRTTDHRTDEEYLNYTKMAIHKMDRINRKGQLLKTTISIIKSIKNPQIWLAITEGWCADAAQSIPYLDKMAALNDDIELKIILREQQPALMDAFLTNGTRSIPKVIIMDTDNLNILGTWGPRPAAAQAIVDKAKSAKAETRDGGIKAMIDYDKNRDLQMWYQKDKGASIQRGFLDALK